MSERTRPTGLHRVWPLALIAAFAMTGGRSALPGSAESQGTPPEHATTYSSLSDTARVRHWREDVNYITEQVRSLHPRPFHHCSEASFDSAARSIRARIATTDDPTLAVECMRMLAMLRDGHTQVVGLLPQLGFDSVLPIAIRPFEDGLYVVAADEANADAVGKKVRRIGDLRAEDALDRVLTVASGENRYTRLDRVPLYLMMPDLLHAMGISASSERVVFELENHRGRRKVITVAGGPRPDGFPQRFLDTEPTYPSNWKTARKTPKEGLPRSDRRPDEAWWYEDLADGSVYLRIRRVEVVSPSARGVVEYRHFFPRLFAHIDSVRPPSLIIDLRQNHGGNNGVVDPLIRGLVERPWLNREGSLFAMIDRGTFSAAMNAVQFLEGWTPTIFVGEPTGGAPNHYGDARRSETPNFKMMLFVSTLPWMSRSPGDPRMWTAPDIAVTNIYARWESGEDVGLAATLEAVREGTRDEQVIAAVNKGGAEAGAAAYREWAKNHPNPWAGDAEEELVNSVWDRMSRAEWTEAARLGEALVTLAPRSAVAFRFAGEAEVHAGNRERGVGYLREAIKISPNAQNARRILEAIGEKP